MSEMSEGAKAAWERWRVEQIKKAQSNIAAHFWNTNPYSEPAFAAGFAAALAAIEREAIHYAELARGERQKHHKAQYNLMAHTLTTTIPRIQNGDRCNDSWHRWCQEANK